MFEHNSQPVISRKEFYRRVFKFFLISLGILLVSIVIGTLGYHYFGQLGWITSFYNASLILSGMGPVDELYSRAAKIFASLYALYSGIAFLVLIGVLFAPAYHRFLHIIHADLDE